jgi:hypothetical protein
MTDLQYDKASAGCLLSGCTTITILSLSLTFVRHLAFL